MDHRTVLELDWARPMAEKAGAAGLGATTIVRVDSAALVAHPDGGGGLLGRIRGWNGWEPIHVWMELPGIAPAAWVVGRGRPGLGAAATSWMIQTAAATADVLNQRVCAVAEYADDPSGTMVIEPAVQLDGDALTQAGAPVEYRAVVELRRLLSMNLSGQLLVGDFAAASELGATPNDLEVYLNGVLTRVRFGSNQVLLAPSRIVFNAQATFSDPWARVWVGPADIGIGSQQLPPDLLNISAERLRLFPSIFLRRAQYVHAVRAPAGASESAVNTPQSAPLVIVTQRPPTYSRWRLWIDGRLADGWVQHPPGSDLRTPYTVWNEVFAASLLGATVVSPFPLYRQIVDIGGTTYHVQGVLGRNTYLEAAEFVSFGDSGPDQDSLSLQHRLT